MRFARHLFAVINVGSQDPTVEGMWTLMSGNPDLSWDGVRWRRRFDGTRWVDVPNPGNRDAPHAEPNRLSRALRRLGNPVKLRIRRL